MSGFTPADRPRTDTDIPEVAALVPDPSDCAGLLPLPELASGKPLRAVVTGARS